ncbi:MAG: hypothetical protein AAF611_00750 [Bacteroidota bacterium]
MKKRNLKSLTLNKKSISNLEVNTSVVGGRGTSERLTECRVTYCVSVFNSCPTAC